MGISPISNCTNKQDSSNFDIFVLIISDATNDFTKPQQQNSSINMNSNDRWIKSNRGYYKVNNTFAEHFKKVVTENKIERDKEKIARTNKIFQIQRNK